MATKFFEKQFFIGVFFLLVGLAFLFNTKLANAPVKIFEKGLLLGVIGFTFLFFSIKFFSKSIHKQ